MPFETDGRSRVCAYRPETARLDKICYESSSLGKGDHALSSFGRGSEPMRQAYHDVGGLNKPRPCVRRQSRARRFAV